MTTFFVENKQIKNNTIQIFGDDFHHIKNVLRLKIGEELHICDDDNNRYLVKLQEYDTASISLEIIERLDYSTELPVNITLFQGLPKQDKLETIIQKTAELGVNEVIPVTMERSVVKVDEKNEAKKQERWQKVAKEASIQSGRQKIPKISPVINFKNIIENIEKYDIVLLPYENEQSVTLKQCLNALDKGKISNIAVIIGPEGGFSEAEINSLINVPNVRIVTLGKRILRTETASIATISMLTYEFGM